MTGRPVIKTGQVLVATASRYANRADRQTNMVKLNGSFFITKPKKRKQFKGVCVRAEK